MEKRRILNWGEEKKRRDYCLNNAGRAVFTIKVCSERQFIVIKDVLNADMCKFTGHTMSERTCISLIKRRKRYPKEVILPIMYPIITSYTQHAHLLSILASYEDAHQWIFSNYIQLYINKNYSYPWGDFYFPHPYELKPSDTCKWIYTQKVNRDFISCKWNSIVDFLIENICMGNYIHTMINYLYVPVSQRYKVSNTNHDMLIYGFDLSKKIFYISDFFRDGKYSFEKIKFKNIQKGFDASNLAENKDYLNGLIYLYKFNHKCDYEFSIKNIVNSIKAYLYCQIPEYFLNYNEKQQKNCVYGLKIYSTLINYIDAKKSENSSDIDIRPFYMLYDHKVLMCLRLKYLKKKNLLTCVNIDKFIEEYNQIEGISNECVNLLVKYLITNEISILNRIIDILFEIEKKESSVLRQLVSECV